MSRDGLQARRRSNPSRGDPQTEFLGPHGLSRARLAHATALSHGRLTCLARGHGRLSGEAALLLARVFRTTPEFWLNLQAHYDLEQAQVQLTATQVARAKAFGVQLRRAHSGGSACPIRW